MSQSVVIYTDGGCHPNPGPGGWAALIIIDKAKKEISGYEPQTTNNRMELTAAIRALLTLKESSQVKIYTDSRYLQRGIVEWMPGWLRKNWQASSGPVANQDLWRELLTAAKPHTVSWQWVRGHAGNSNNIRVDWLVKQARKKTA
ncbi:MAG: ribonuclease HI [Anaerolineaceae bacterium]